MWDALLLGEFSRGAVTVTHVKPAATVPAACAAERALEPKDNFRIMESLDLHSALASCNYYPAQIDLKHRLVWFAEIDRETYRRAGFLVPKQACMGEERYGFNLDDVLLYDLNLPIGGAPSHYVFISAFCCSTLLARLLDRVPGCFVLKEPSILGQLAMSRYKARSDDKGAEEDASPFAHSEPRGESRAESSEWEQEWRTWATLGLRLLTRTFEPGQTVIVKAADVCNLMCDVILANNPGSKALLLSVGMRTFILSVLKAEDRKDWIRKRASFWHSTPTLFPAFNTVNVRDLDDAGKAAYAWLVTAALWDRFGKQAAPERLLLMDGDQVSENPRDSLRKAAAFFALPLEEDRLEEILAHPVVNHHENFRSKVTTPQRGGKIWPIGKTVSGRMPIARWSGR